MIEGVKIYEDGRWLEAEIDRQEKEEVERLSELIREAKRIENLLQKQYVRLTGKYCL